MSPRREGRREGQRARRAVDEAYLRVMAGHVEPRVLPGQVDALSGRMVGERDGTPEPAIETLPDACPGCGRPMPYAHSWTHMKATDEPRVQCGGCGHIVVVTPRTWALVREAARRMFAASDSPPPKKERAPRMRGAG